MAKFAVVEVDENEKAIGFYNGATFVEDANAAQVFEAKDTANFYMGRALQAFSDKEIRLKSVNIEVSIEAPTPTAARAKKVDA